MDKNHKDPDTTDLGAPRLAWYKQKKWKIHQDTVYWVDKQLAQQKGFEFYQTRSNAIILYDAPPVTRKYIRQVDFFRRFSLKSIGRKNWVHKLLERK